MGFNHLEDWELRKLQRELKNRSPWTKAAFCCTKRAQDAHKELAAVDRKTLRELERENTPDLDTVLAETGYQYRKPKEKRHEP